MEALAKIQAAVEKARSWLPEQGPIDAFIHHNTLHHFEDLTMEAAVEMMAEVRGSKPYLFHDEYLSLIAEGRISDESLSQSLTDYERDHCQSPWPLEHIMARRDVLHACLKLPFARINETSLNWIIENEGMLSQKEDAKLWHGIRRLPAKTPRFLKVKADASVYAFRYERLIAFLAAYLDQGVSFWRLPEREKGLFEAFKRHVLSGDKHLPNTWRWFPDSENFHAVTRHGPGEAVYHSLRRLGISMENWESYIRDTLLEIPGWAGAIHYLEKNKCPGFTSIQPRLMDFLAILLLSKIRWQQREDKLETSESPTAQVSCQLQLFQVLKNVGVTAETLASFDQPSIEALQSTIINFDDVKRRRYLQLAFEKEYRQCLADSLIFNSRRQKQDKNSSRRPSFQALFCLDEREESFRRYLEEIDPHCETYGLAGFFNVDMNFKGVFSEETAPYCPVVIKPQHRVTETLDARDMPRRHGLFQTLRKHFHQRTHGLATGMVLSSIWGLALALPMALMMMFPRLAAKIWGRIHDRRAAQATKLLFQKEETGEGYTIEEMAARVEALLKSIGLVSNFAPFVFIVAHGSNSRNNPHLSAYNCGACGGRPGWPNARVFAAMANNPEVRAHLAKKSLVIPNDTFFVGAFHETCAEDVTFDLQGLAVAGALEAFAKYRKVFDAARELNAFERCRRFEIADHSGPARALAHAEQRSLDLREPRPECGHATNASCIIARRQMTQGLFLDRRAFLNSYDPGIDPDGSVLKGVMSAAIPVCAGINLEYYFSLVDNVAFGCGSKLPHNVVGLLGVMEGGSSDLRTGLPWQMVEIHEPVRMVTVIETTREILKANLTELPGIKKLVQNRWITLGVMEPGSHDIYWLEDEEFVRHQVKRHAFFEAKSSSTYHGSRLASLEPAYVKGEGSGV